MRSRDELLRAHDMLVSLMLDTDFLKTATTEELNVMMAQANVLCWVLGHAHNTKFADLLLGIEQDLAEQGIVLVNRGAPAPGPAKENLG